MLFVVQFELVELRNAYIDGRTSVKADSIKKLIFRRKNRKDSCSQNLLRTLRYGSMLTDGFLFLSFISLSALHLSLSNNVASLPKFLSPAALAKISHQNCGPFITCEDELEKAAIGLDWSRIIIDAKSQIESNDKDTITQQIKAVRNVPQPKNKFNAFKVILAGAPAAGKGTQCEVIQTNFGLVHLSTGDILRNAVEEGTLLGLMAKPYMDAGHLVPDDLVIELILSRLKDNDCETRGWLLDGFPRTKSQADALHNSGILPDVFLLLDVPEDILIERVTGRRTDPLTGKIYHLTFNPPENDEVASRLVQRSDDTAEKVIVRYREFQSHIGAIKSSYEDKMVLIDGSLKPSDVTKFVVAELDSAILKKRDSFSDGGSPEEISSDISIALGVIAFPALLKEEFIVTESSTVPV